MFEHLDDPAPPVATLATLREIVRVGRRRHRRRLAAVTAAVAVLLGGAGLAVASIQERLTVDRVDVAGLDPAGGVATNVLLVGVDSARAGAGGRPDMVAIVRVDAAARSARVLSIPRDLR